MPDLTDLIERLEKATEGSRELDGLIWQALGNPVPRCPDWHLRVPSPRWTTSVDAALALVPDGCYVRTLSQWSDGWCCMAYQRGRLHRGDKKPAPLALCIGALKARQAAS